MFVVCLVLINHILYDGMVERFNRGLENLLTVFVEKHPQDWVIIQHCTKVLEEPHLVGVCQRSKFTGGSTLWFSLRWTIFSNSGGLCGSFVEKDGECTRI